VTADAIAIRTAENEIQNGREAIAGLLLEQETSGTQKI